MAGWPCPGLAVVVTGHVAVARPEMADGLRDGRGVLAAAAGQVAAVRPETADEGFPAGRGALAAAAGKRLWRGRKWRREWLLNIEGGLLLRRGKWL